MASEAANIGANFSQYTGDPSLGGGTLGAVRIDTRPIEDLARYTFLYNKSEYDQRQKDAEKAAAEIADYMSFDLVNGIPKFSKQLQDKNDKLLKFISENPDAINYKNRKAWTEYQRLKGDLSNDIAAAKLNETIFMARNREVENETLPLEKERLQKNLDKDIEALNIRDRLRYTDKFDVKPIEVGAAPIIDIQNTDIGRNFTGQATTKLPDMRIARNTASGVANGLLKITADKGQFGDQYEADVASGKLEPILSSQYFNAAIQQYKSDPKYLNSDGTLNIDKVIADDSGIVGRNLENVKAFNLYMRSIKDRINQGYFKDNFGGQLRFTNDASGLSERDYKEINIDDGYSPDEIVLTKMLAQTPGISRTIKLDETDLGIKKENLSIDWAKLGLAKKQYDLEESKFKTATTGTEEDKTAALSFAQNLFLDIASKGSIKVKGGGVVLTPDDIRKLGQDQLKYLGIEQPVKRDEDGKIIESGGLQPLSLDPNDVIELAPDGTVKVLKGAKFDEKTDRWYGQWDQSRSTSVWNAARNLLNEENVKSGTKERNAYFPIDLRGKAGVIQIDQSGGKTTTEITQTTKTPEGTMAEWLATPGWTKERVLEYKKKGLIKVK